MDKEVRKINDILVNLYNLVLKLEEDAIRKDSSHNNVSIKEVHTLVAIGTGRPKTMTHVANILGINVSTLTIAINRLVKKGYVKRLRDEKDRRIVKVGLTEDGISAVRAHEEFHTSMISEAVAGMPPDELKQFVSSIDNIQRFLMMRSATYHNGAESFSMAPIKLGNHELPVPLVQAGMSMGIAASGLASAVAIEGGLGLIGALEIGQGRPGYEENRLETNLRTVREEVSRARKLTEEAGGKGLIGISIMWNRPHVDKYIETAVKAGAQVIVTGGAIPKDLPKYCSDRNVALVPTVSSKRAVSAIMRTWTQKYNRTPDAFIFQGPQAAGLLGFRMEQLDRAREAQYRTMAAVGAELSKLENCPLIFGGGIYSREDAVRAYQYGADGYLLGTRFVTTRECDAPEEFRKLYLNCSENDVTIIRSPMKTSVRVLSTPFAGRLDKEGTEDYDIVEAAVRGVQGDLENGLVFCSETAGRTDRLETVRDVFREFTTLKK